MEHKEAYPPSPNLIGASGDSRSLGLVGSPRIDYTEIALAERFYYGREVPRNLAAAWRWYRNAAERGEPLAQYQLGRMYAEGQGADADPLNAYMWVELASRRSTGALQEKCLEFLAHLAERLAPEEVAAAQLQTVKWKAKRGGRPSHLRKAANYSSGRWNLSTTTNPDAL